MADAAETATRNLFQWFIIAVLKDLQEAALFADSVVLHATFRAPFFVAFTTFPPRQAILEPCYRHQSHLNYHGSISHFHLGRNVGAFTFIPNPSYRQLDRHRIYESHDIAKWSAWFGFLVPHL